MMTSPDPSSSWRRSAAPVSIPHDRLDIWRLQLDAPADPESGGSILSPDEIVRADRYRFARDKHRFVACRSALRRLLGEYLAVSAQEVSFEYSATGKPSLKAENNLHALCFNVAHSGELALIAFGASQQLGVDIEKIRGEVDTKSLAERFFSEREREELRALPEHIQVLAFFACWSRKEAFIKATGDGLSFPLADFSVSVDPDQRPAVEEIKGSSEAGRRWCLDDLAVGGDYRAAVAVDALHLPIQTLSFPWK